MKTFELMTFPKGRNICISSASPNSCRPSSQNFVLRPSPTLRANKLERLITASLSKSMPEPLKLDPARVENMRLGQFLRLLFSNICNKLECLSIAGLSTILLCLWVRSGANHSGAHERCFPQVGSYLTRNLLTRLERLARDNYSILLQTLINYSRKLITLGLD
jgi:hypothetical protein